jgi:hypothetical protein
MFAHHNPHIMDIRGESVNMLALLRAVPKIHLGAVAYLEAYIDFVKPKLILSRTDNNATLWQLKRRPNSTYKVALIQNGWRIADSPGGETHMIGAKGFENLDIYFSMGEAARSSFNKNLNVKYVDVGSLSLNFYPKPTDQYLGAQVVSLVSIFRPSRSDEEQGCKDLGSFARATRNRNLKINIIGSQVSAERAKLERSFYDKAFANQPFELLVRSSTRSSYEKLSNSSIFIVDQSTLGYEALSIGLRVGFVSFQPSFRLTDRFGLPLEFGEKGPFWTNDPSEEEIGRILDYLLTVSDEQWERDSGWIRDQLMVHDYGNTKIRAYVEGVLTGSLKSN